MKKKLLSLALACGMVFSLAACGTPANNESPAPNTESPAIGTETPAADTPTYCLLYTSPSPRDCS